MSGLEDYKNQIREIDRSVLCLIKDRSDIEIRLPKVKQSLNLPTVDTDAEQEKVDNSVTIATRPGINISFTKQLGGPVENAIEVQGLCRPKQSNDYLPKEIAEIPREMLVEGINSGQSFGDYQEFFKLAAPLPERQMQNAIRLIG